MMNKTLYILGASGHGRVVVDAAKSLNRFSEFLFLDDDPSLKKCGGIQVIGNRHSLPPAGPETAVFVAIGMNNALRLNLTKHYLSMGYEVPTIIHATAHVAESAHIGAGTVIMAQCAVNPGSSIGQGCIINTGATVDHDCHIADGVHISPGANVSGNVAVGLCSHLGTGCAIIHGQSENHKLSIGANSTIGAGAAVIGDIPDNVTAVGVPAIPIDKS